MKLSRRVRVIEQLRKAYPKGRWVYVGRNVWKNKKVGEVEAFVGSIIGNLMTRKYMFYDKLDLNGDGVRLYIIDERSFKL